MDQDKREVRLLQELYFEDGDLGEGNRRKRNFRWRNSDVGFGKDGEHKLSDEENEEPLTEIDIKQRMERIERENFIQQQEVIAFFFILGCNLTFHEMESKHHIIYHETFHVLV